MKNGWRILLFAIVLVATKAWGRPPAGGPEAKGGPPPDRRASALAWVEASVDMPPTITAEAEWLLAIDGEPLAKDADADPSLPSSSALFSRAVTPGEHILSARVVYRERLQTETAFLEGYRVGFTFVAGKEWALTGQVPFEAKEGDAVRVLAKVTSGGTGPLGPRLTLAPDSEAPGGVAFAANSRSAGGAVAKARPSPAEEEDRVAPATPCRAGNQTACVLENFERLFFRRSLASRARGPVRSWTGL
ncbi:MAG: hypothetical protein HYZ28_04025 [Myxococcales bacterium]|nr:hypothetical protein [Myxococcales bacterium]